MEEKREENINISRNFLYKALLLETEYSAYGQSRHTIINTINV